jgi:hypothetical protein
MEPMIARAFLYRMLGPNEREKLNAIELSMPRGRYLQGFEICRLFNLEPKPITEAQENQMKEVRAGFEKILWKQRVLEMRAENPGRTNEELTGAVDGKIGPEDLSSWQPYAVLHYREPSGSFKEATPGREYVG